MNPEWILVKLMPILSDHAARQIPVGAVIPAEANLLDVVSLTNLPSLSHNETETSLNTAPKSQTPVIAVVVSKLLSDFSKNARSAANNCDQESIELFLPPSIPAHPVTAKVAYIRVLPTTFRLLLKHHWSGYNWRGHHRCHHRLNNTHSWLLLTDFL